MSRNTVTMNKSLNVFEFRKREKGSISPSKSIFIVSTPCGCRPEILVTKMEHLDFFSES